MKLLPIPLSPLGAPPLGMWSSDFLWRYPAAPPSPLAELKTQLPTQLSSDPRLWGRDEVVVFLRWTEREFDLPKFELDLFQMNGKALCLLTKNDLAERCPGAGDIIHNVLQLLIRDAQMLQRPFRSDLPSSPITPTNRYPLSPHSHPPTPNWNSLVPPNGENSFYASHLQHFMQSNSVTLSPAPSIDSQAGSPPGQEAPTTIFSTNSTNDAAQASSSDSHSPSEARSGSASGASATAGNSSRSSSNHSDSEEENFKHKIPKLLPPPIHHKSHLSSHQKQSPPVTPIFKESSSSSTSTTPSLLSHQLGDFKQHIFFNGTLDAVNNASGSSSSASPSTPTTPGYLSVKREFFPDTPNEPNTNGRLLWDFLQQLLNDHQQRYSNYIAWKCRDTGVFKIVDPAGLAKLWGIQKNHLSMNYDKMSRALRYYYRVNILRKVQGERHCYQFLRNPTELKSIKNISLLRQTMTSQQQSSATASSSTSSSSTSTVSEAQNSAAALQASALASLLPQSTTNFHHLTAALVQSSNNLKLQFGGRNNTAEDEPHDLSTTSSSNQNENFIKNAECYPLIHGANGLTTIQLLRQSQENSSSQSPSSSPTSLSPPIHHLSLHKENQDQQQHQQGEEMPTDLRKINN